MREPPPRDAVAPSSRPTFPRLLSTVLPDIYIYIYIHVFLTPLYLHCIYFRAPTLSIHFEKHSRTRELADPTFRFFPRFFIPRSNNRSINRIDRIIRYSIIIVSRLKCDHEVSRCFSSAVELGKNWLHEAE